MNNASINLLVLKIGKYLLHLNTFTYRLLVQELLISTRLQYINVSINFRLLKIIITLFILIPILYGCNSVEPNINEGDIDTTSHNFTFETFTFGEHSSSVLYDVTIIDENNIWAVGEIYLNDSLGQPDTQPYGVARWDGLNWYLMKVPYHDFNQTVEYPGPLFAITEINNNIYVASYANLLKWTGNDWEEIAFFMEQVPFDGQVIKIWGTNENHIYCVGRNGSIYFYFGSDWQKISSNTNLNIYDIFGQKTDSGKYDVLCVAANLTVNTDKKIMRIEQNTVSDNVLVTGITSSISSIWFKPNIKYYVVGSGMFTKTDINSTDAWKPIWKGITEYYTTSVDGNDTNDIIVCGAYGEMLHFNGSTWKSYQAELKLETGSYSEVKISDDLVIAVGHNSPKAVITIGRR